MKLLLNNFAKVEHAEIKCDGITIIAGENNTGKSTIGKVLFSVFNSTHGLNKKIEQERRKELRKVLQRNLNNYFSEIDRDVYIKKRRILMRPIDKICDEILEVDIESGRQKQENYIYDIIQRNCVVELDDRIIEITNKLIEIINLPDEKIELEYISRYFKNIFYEQINSISEDKKEASIVLNIKNKEMKLNFSDNKCNIFKSEYNILNNAFYIENPFIIDDLNNIGRVYYSTSILKDNIISQITSDKSDIMEGVINSISVENKLESIYDILENVVKGTVNENENGEYYFRGEEQKRPINVNNLSTGLKSFILIKMLLENGILKEKDVLILDEPEIHLHPEWQIYYAELIVLLQREFDLTVIITTHSPYFIDAIEVFSAKHKISDRINYYLSDNVNGYFANVKDVTNNIELIYRKLAAPMQQLENMRNGIINNE